MDSMKQGWFTEFSEMWPGQAISIEVEKVLHDERSDFQHVIVADTKTYGRMLCLDGVIMLTERDEFAYQEMIGHLPMFSHPNPKKVLVIGGGDGGVLRELARHESVEELHICELDKMVIDVSRKYIPSTGVGFDDPRVHVHIMDGAEYMRQNQGTFDVIIVDSSDPIGPASTLFEKQFYENIRNALAPGGVVCTQGECMWLHLNLIGPMLEFCQELFDTAEYAYTTIPTYPSGQIGFLLCTKAPREQKTCSKPVRKPTEAVQNVLKYYSPEMHEAAFVLPPFVTRAFAAAKKAPSQ